MSLLGERSRIVTKRVDLPSDRLIHDINLAARCFYLYVHYNREAEYVSEAIERQQEGLVDEGVGCQA